MTATRARPSVAPEPATAPRRPEDEHDWLGRFERAFQAIAAEPDTERVIARLCAEVRRVLDHSATVEFLPIGPAPANDRADGTTVAVHTQRGRIGTLFIRGTVSHNELRAIRLLASLAGQISSRSIHDQRLELAHRHERNAVAVYEAARDLVSIPDVDVVLDAIARRAQEFTGADVAYLAVQVPGSEVYEHRASSGTRTATFEGIRVAGLKGLTELAARERQVIISNDFLNDPRRNTALDRYFRAEDLVSVVCAPMHMGDEFIGALFVADRRHGSLSVADADLLAALGAIAAGAIVNARLHVDERRRADELARINEVVAAQHAQLERWMQTHQRLTRMVLDGQSLPRIAAMIAQIVGNPVGVVDRSSRLRAFADPAAPEAPNGLSGSALREAIQEAVCKEPPQRDRTTVLSVAGGDVNAISAPVITRSGLLGHLIVVERDASIDDQTRTFIGQAANAVAIEFMQERVAAEVETRLRGELLGELISQSVSDVDELRQRAGLLGHDLDGDLRLIVARADEPPNGGRRRDAQGQLVLALADALGATVPRPLLVVRHQRAVALITRQAVAAGERTGPEGATAEELRERVTRQLGRAVSVVAGPWVGQPGELPAAYASVVKCLEAYAASGRRGFAVDFETSRFERIVVEMSGTRHAEAFVEEVLGKVVAYDRRRHGVLIESLEQYLLADSVLEKAARALHVHPHTLRYRLDKVTQLSGRSTADPEAKLEMLLALRLHRAVGEGQSRMTPTAG